MTTEPECDWTRDFDLAGWQKRPAAWRQQWISEHVWRQPELAPGEDHDAFRRRHYERGQTAWDIDLGPQRFDLTLAMALGGVKPEHGRGVLFWAPDVRVRVLSALLANAGLVRTVRLAPRPVWDQALLVYAATVAWQRTLAADRTYGTRAARYDRPPERTPVVRAEFVTVPSPHDDRSFWMRHRLAHSFHSAEFLQPTDVRDLRVEELGYVQIGDHTLARTDLLVLRPGHRHHGHQWPTPADAALIAEVAISPGDILFDVEVRLAAYLAAGAEEVWVVDAHDQRILRQRRGQSLAEVRYRDAEQATGWYDAGGERVEVALAELFGSRQRAGTRVASDGGDMARSFATHNAAERAWLEACATPWTIGHTPQWFGSTIVELLGRFKDELWDGVLFGAEHRRDELLSMLLANVGLHDVLKLAPLELWQQAVAESPQPGL